MTTDVKNIAAETFAVIATVLMILALFIPAMLGYMVLRTGEWAGWWSLDQDHVSYYV